MTRAICTATFEATHGPEQLSFAKRAADLAATMSTEEIAIIDYGMGNLRSIANMLDHIGAPAVITGDVDRIASAERLILPGVGAFGAGMRSIEERGLREILDQRVLKDRVPVLGICLGMQLMGRSSAEGGAKGLGWLDAESRRFAFDERPDLKIPHMGWNLVDVAKPSSLFEDGALEPRFYFVHSYHFVCAEESDVLCTTHHGYDFTSAVERDNIQGVQFHPEKSHRFGMRLLAGFAGLPC